MHSVDADADQGRCALTALCLQKLLLTIHYVDTDAYMSQVPAVSEYVEAQRDVGSIDVEGKRFVALLALVVVLKWSGTDMQPFVLHSNSARTSASTAAHRSQQAESCSPPTTQGAAAAGTAKAA